MRVAGAKRQGNAGYRLTDNQCKQKRSRSCCAATAEGVDTLYVCVGEGEGQGCCTCNTVASNPITSATWLDLA